MADLDVETFLFFVRQADLMDEEDRKAANKAARRSR